MLQPPLIGREEEDNILRNGQIVNLLTYINFRSPYFFSSGST